VKESCVLDLTDYFKKIFTLDMLILNEDRHLNNLAVILKGNMGKDNSAISTGKIQGII
jgi:hypothetical protein